MGRRGGQVLWTGAFFLLFSDAGGPFQNADGSRTAGGDDLPAECEFMGLGARLFYLSYASSLSPPCDPGGTPP